MAAGGKSAKKHKGVTLTAVQKRNVRRSLREIERTNRDLQLRVQRVRKQLEAGDFVGG